MAWLDALRAVAALLVVYAHLSHYLLRGVRTVSAEWLHAGTAGVMLFFLVSGYIIPASLERHGNLRTFWINRLARLLPLYVVVAVLCVAVLPLDPYLSAHPATSAVAHATMLTHLLGVPLVTPVFWTLTFEMAFYLIVSALFALGRHRASGLIAVGFAVAAVATAPLSPHLIAGPALSILAAAALIVGLMAITSGRHRAVLAGAVVLLALAATLLLADQDGAHVWDGLLIPAVMFVGTTIYRAEQGQIPRRRAVAVAAIVAAALLINWFAELHALHALVPRYMARSVITLAVFAGAFAIGMACRKRRVPRLLAWLGLVSYSLYLVHYPLIQLLHPVLTWLGEHLHGAAELPAVVAFLAVLSSISALTYYFVEKPGQRVGRRFARPAHPGVPTHSRLPSGAANEAKPAETPELTPSER
jgi:peptidoglycan/LPS O-acetylase OafA/YrhL